MQSINLAGEWFSNRYTLSFGVAFILHLLFFLFYGSFLQFLALIPASKMERLDLPPMIFEFIEVSEKSPAENLPKETQLLSDRNLIGRDFNEVKLQPSYLPYSEGLVEFKENFETRFSEKKRKNTLRGISKEWMMSSLKSESQDQLRAMLSETQVQTRHQLEEAVYGKEAILKMNNQKSNALDRGNFQLSTYAWDFAPYMSYLNRKIYRQAGAVLPPAFKDYGLIEGETIIRFKIQRDGMLNDLEVLNYAGSVLLRDASLLAVQQSAPFKPLPSHFPDPYLELYWTFVYSLIGSFDEP